MTLPFLSMPCSQTPPESPATIAFCGRLLLPSRFSTLSASGCSCHEAQSLHVCYGLDIALSTLNSCCCLHEPKTRFPVGRLFPFPGRESHPLKAPGLPWRTEEFTEVQAAQKYLKSRCGLLVPGQRRSSRLGKNPYAVRLRLRFVLKRRLHQDS